MSFQDDVDKWLIECFGEKVARDKTVRNWRFLEEALELVQSCDCTRDDALKLVEYVFNRPTGEKFQEVGGVMTTLSALCLAHEIDLSEAAEAGLQDCWSRIEQIRRKSQNKPRFSPLPE